MANKKQLVLLKQFSVICLSLMLGACNLNGGENFDSQLAADARIELGLTYLQGDNPRQALRNLQLALKDKPNYAKALSAMAYYYQYTNQTHLAKKFYQQALEMEPNNGDTLNNFGVFLCKIYEFDLAVTYLKKAAYDPNYPDRITSLENAGICRVRQGRPDLAKDYFQRVLLWDPKREFSAQQLAQIQQE